MWHADTHGDGVIDIPDIHYVRNGGVALAYQVLGDEPLDLVYIPGFINNIDIAWDNPHYARFLRRLSSFSRLILMDRRGTGLSDRMSPEDLPPLEVLMDDLGVVLNAVGSKRTALFGAGDSGCLCAMFAATYPDRVAALALFGVSAAGTAAEDYPWQWSEGDWEEYFTELTTGWGTLAYAQKTLPRWHPSFAGDERMLAWWARFMRQAATPTSVEAIERIWHLIDIRPILPTIRVPTLVVHRADNPNERVEAGRDVADRIPGARFLELPGGDDAPWAGDQDAVLDAIEEFLTGRPHIAEIDRVLSSVLFTDIVGSTERAATLGDARWRELLEEHNRIVRTELERFRGMEVSTAGDGFFARFDGPARAAQCARAIGIALAPLGLEIRAGVHTGEVELMGADVGGIAVHVGSRVAALAGPSEILVSSTVKDLVAGSGLTFEDAGEQELRGVPDRWHLYRVT
jgi:class 3 adenylate cyclase